MPVKHDLYADLKLTCDEVKKRREADPTLSRLLDHYDGIDKEVVEAEKAAAADDEVKKLKEARLIAKDKIVQQLEYPGTQGVGKDFDK